MLKILRNKKTAKKIWIALAAIIIPAFAFWGFGEAIRSRQENIPKGKIFGNTVSNLEFNEALVAVRTQAIMQFGDELPQFEKILNLPSRAWERLTLLYEAKRRNINVSDTQVIELIQNTPYFRDKAGFNNRVYEQTLRYVFRLKPRSFEEQTRQNLILSKLYEQITEKVKLTDEEIRQEYLKANQELSIYYTASLFSDATKKIKPNEKEIADYFERNKLMFKLPPQADKEARIPALSEVKNKVKNALIDEETKKLAENKIKDCSNNQEKCSLKTQSTEFFKYKEKIKNLGDAGIFWENAKKLKDNQSSPIFSNDKGFYIIRLKSIKPIDEAKFVKEKSELTQQLLTEKKGEVFAKFSQELKKKSQ